MMTTGICGYSRFTDIRMPMPSSLESLSHRSRIISIGGSPATAAMASSELAARRVE